MNHETNLDVLIDFALGELEPDAAARLQRHAAENTDTAAALERVQRMLRALNSRDMQDLTPSLHQRLRALLTAQPSARPSWIETASQVLNLLLDTRLAPARGFRSWSGDTSLLTFGGPRLSVDVQISPKSAPTPESPGRWAIRGCAEVEGRTQAVDVALLSVKGRPPLYAATDEHGQFSLEVPEGACSLALNAGGQVFTTPPFDIP